MKKIIFILIVIIFASCKSEKEEKKNNNQINMPKKEIVLHENIKDLKEGLDNFWQVEAPNGAKILVNMDKIFYIKENPTVADIKTRYFLHVKLKNGELINMDFNYKDHELKSKDQSGFKNYAIAYRELTEEPIFSILTGQFNEDGRIWQIVLHEQNFY